MGNGLSKRRFEDLRQDVLGETDMERRIRHFSAFVERNKSHRGRGEPPSRPCPVEPRKGGPYLSGGAAAELVFENA